MNGTRALATLAGCLFSTLPAWSQGVLPNPTPGLPTPSFPAPIQQPLPLQPAPRRPSPLEGAPPSRPAPDPAAPSQPVPGETPRGEQPGAPTLVVRQFRFVGSTVFSQQQLRQRTDAYRNRPLTFAQLSEARQAITQLYIDQGYVTSGAYIPMQTSRDGVVEIRILEGRLGRIDVNVQGRLRPGYLRSRLQRASRGVFNQKRLENELRLLQANPLIERIQATLAASPEPGVSTLAVTVQSARSFQAAAALDNGRNPQTGSFRRGVDLGDANLLGYGDGLSLAYRNSDGSNDLLLSYQLPLNSSDLTLTATYRDLYSWIIQPPLNALNIHSHYRQWFVGLRQPILRSLEKEFALGLSLNKQDNQGLFLNGFPYPGRGVNANGETRVSTLSFSQDWTQRTARQVLAIRSELGLGLRGLDTTTPLEFPADPNAPDASFLLWRADGQYVRQLATDTLLVARGRAQLADGPLPSVEQFGLGGQGSVEGYQTNSLLTDNGLFASVEVALPILRLFRNQGLLQLVPFTAIGTGWDAGPAAQPPVNVLASVGLGLQLRVANHLYGRLDYAQRLGKTPYAVSDMWQDQALLFTLRYGL